LVTSVRRDQAATSLTFLYGVKSNEDIRRSYRMASYTEGSLPHISQHCACPERVKSSAQLRTVLPYVKF
jgi:hypothetical protein